MKRLLRICSLLLCALVLLQAAPLAAAAGKTFTDVNPGDWFYLAVQEATNSHAFKHKAGNYETWIGMSQNPDWTRYED